MNKIRITRTLTISCALLFLVLMHLKILHPARFSHLNDLRHIGGYILLAICYKLAYNKRRNIFITADLVCLSLVIETTDTLLCNHSASYLYQNILNDMLGLATGIFLILLSAPYVPSRRQESR